jgi:hypothetical protein
MSSGFSLASRVAAGRARTRAALGAVGSAVTDAELARVEGILRRAHDRAGVPYGAPLPAGYVGPDEQARIDAIVRAARGRLAAAQ